MGLFNFGKKKVEERSASEYSYREGTAFSISSFFGGTNGITEEKALEIPTIKSGVELITSSIAQLPIYLYKQNDKGEVERVPDRRERLLNDEPNEMLTGYSFKKNLTKDFLFYGASYNKIEMVRNDVIAIYPLPTKDITVTRYLKEGYKYSAKVNLLATGVAGGNAVKEFDPIELLTILKDSDDGITSKGILQTNSKILNLAYNEQVYTNSIISNGALPIGVLKSAGRLTQKAIDNLRLSWANLYQGAENAGKTVILEEGLEYSALSLKPNEMDLSNSRKNTVSEIARILNVPESMINAYANKYASNEQNNIFFLQYCISPIISAIEASLNKSFLLEKEKNDGYYFRFDTSEILRVTEKEKVETIVASMKGGLCSINEARAKLDIKALDDDFFMWSLGNVFYNPKTKMMSIPNLGAVVDPNDPESFAKLNKGTALAEPSIEDNSKGGKP